MKNKDNKTKTFADISKHIKSKYEDRYDPVSLNGLKSEMKRLRDHQEEMKQQEELLQQQEQFALGGLFDRPMPSTDINLPLDMPGLGRRNGGNYEDISGLPSLPERPMPMTDIMKWSPEKMTDRTFGTTVEKNSTPNNSSITRDPLMYASAMGPLAALLMNKRTDPIDRGAAGRFVSTGKGEAGVGTSNPRQTQFDEVSMSPIERALSERARAFSGANVQASGGNAGQFLSNELANQANILNAQGQANLGQQQMNTQIAGMNAQEQARIDQMKMQDRMRQQQAEQTNAQLMLQYDQIDDMNEGAFRTNQSNAVQGILQNLGNIGRENTQNNIILKALGYDEMGNYGGEGKNSFKFLNSFFNKFFNK